MFDIGWSELLVLAVIAIIIVGPKDLPRMLYALGQTAGKLRRQADEFRRQFNESMREAGMEDVVNDVKQVRDMNPTRHIRDEIESTFSDNPTKSTSTDAGQTAENAPEDSSEPAEPAFPPSEGDLLPPSDAPEPRELTSAEGHNGASAPASAETTPAQNESTASGSPNGAAKAKDAVS